MTCKSERNVHILMNSDNIPYISTGGFPWSPETKQKISEMLGKHLDAEKAKGWYVFYRNKKEYVVVVNFYDGPAMTFGGCEYLSYKTVPCAEEISRARSFGIDVESAIEASKELDSFEERTLKLYVAGMHGGNHAAWRLHV